MSKRILLSGVGVAVGAAAVVAALAFLGLLPTGGPGGPSGPAAKGGGFPAAVVQVARVREKYVEPRQVFVGTVLPVKTSKVGSAASGRVESFPAEEGAWVMRRDVLAQLRTRTIEAELEAARRIVEARAAELRELEASLEDERRQAQARVAMKRAMREYLEARRRRTLEAPSAFSREVVEEATAMADEAVAALKEAEASLKLLEEPRNLRIEMLKAKVLEAQADADRLEDQWKRHTIVSPFDGYVVKEYTEAGEWVLQSGLVAEVAKLDEVDVEVPVLEDYVSLVQVGDKVPVEVNALPGRQFWGTVAIITPKANEKARTFPVKVRVRNVPSPAAYQEVAAAAVAAAAPGRPLAAAGALFPGRLESGGVLLKAGMLARVVLPIAAKQNATFVPRDALVLNGDKRMVYAVQAESSAPGTGTVRPVDVALGVSDDKMVQVSGPLLPGDLIVAEGNERLYPGAKVQFSEQ